MTTPHLEFIPNGEFNPYSFDMLTSNDARAARTFNYSLRDAVDTVHADAYLDRLIMTLEHYELNGCLHPQGLTAIEAAGAKFKLATGQGYPRQAVERLRQSAVEALRTYESSLQGGSELRKPLTRINRVKQLAPHVSLAQTRASSEPSAQTRTAADVAHEAIAAQSKARKDTPSSAPGIAPALEQSAPSPASAYVAPNPAGSPQSVGSTHTSSDTAGPLPVRARTAASPAQSVASSLGAVPSSLEEIAAARRAQEEYLAAEQYRLARERERIAQQFADQERAFIEQQERLDAERRAEEARRAEEERLRIEAEQKRLAEQARREEAYRREQEERLALQQRELEERERAAAAEAELAKTSEQDRIAYLLHKQEEERAERQRAKRAARESSAASPSDALAGSPQAIVEQLNNALRTREALVAHSPGQYPAVGTIKVSTSSGMAEVVSARLHQDGSIILETKRSK